MFWSCCLVEIIKIKSIQDLFENLWYDLKKLLWWAELNPRVRCAFGNVLVVLWYIEVEGKKSFSDSDIFSWVELDPKFGILAFSAIFVLFFWVAKTLIYIDNAFNGYSYLKSTRKELSDGTLMLKKEYRVAR